MDAVAAAYEAGVDIAFEKLFAGEARHRVSLPGYPFQCRRHWLQPTRRRRSDTGHPLLGVRHESALASIFHGCGWWCFGGVGGCVLGCVFGVCGVCGGVFSVLAGFGGCVFGVLGVFRWWLGIFGGGSGCEGVRGWRVLRGCVVSVE